MWFWAGNERQLSEETSMHENKLAKTLICHLHQYKRSGESISKHSQRSTTAHKNTTSNGRRRRIPDRNGKCRECKEIE